MDEAIAKIGRDNHLNNLFSKLPLITAIFGLQCFFLMQMEDRIDIGEFSVLMGSFLVFMISALYIYDKHHHVIIYKDRITIYFSPLNLQKTIPLNEIENIHGPENECDYASLTFELTSKELLSIHFVDNPVQVKSVIEDLQKGQDVSDRIDLDQAA